MKATVIGVVIVLEIISNRRREGVRICQDKDMNDAPESAYTRVAVIENQIEAQLIGSILSEQGIPHRIRSFHDTAYDGLFQFQQGWGVLYVQITDQQKALDILDDVRSTDASV